MREPPEAGYDAAQLGSMLHEILQKVYPASGNPQDIDAVLAAGDAGVVRTDFVEDVNHAGLRVAVEPPTGGAGAHAGYNRTAAARHVSRAPPT